MLSRWSRIFSDKCDSGNMEFKVKVGDFERSTAANLESTPLPVPSCISRARVLMSRREQCFLQLSSPSSISSSDNSVEHNVERSSAESSGSVRTDGRIFRQIPTCRRRLFASPERKVQFRVGSYTDEEDCIEYVLDRSLIDDSESQYKKSMEECVQQLSKKRTSTGDPVVERYTYDNDDSEGIYAENEMFLAYLEGRSMYAVKHVERSTRIHGNDASPSPYTDESDASPSPYTDESDADDEASFERIVVVREVLLSNPDYRTLPHYSGIKSFVKMGKFSDNPGRASYTFRDDWGIEHGPLCVSCMTKKYLECSVHKSTFIKLHTRNGDGRVHLSDLIDLNGASCPFLDKDNSGEKKYKKNTCVGEDCVGGRLVDGDAELCRGRTMTRRLSGFYRSNFGEYSPEEYLNLRMYGFGSKFQPNEVKSLLKDRFRTFEPFEVRSIINNENVKGEPKWWVYVNFERRDCAKTIRHTMMDSLKKSFGPNLICDPAGIVRDQGGIFNPDKFTRQRMHLQKDRVTVQVTAMLNDLLRQPVKKDYKPVVHIKNAHLYSACKKMTVMEKCVAKCYSKPKNDWEEQRREKMLSRLRLTPASTVTSPTDEIAKKASLERSKELNSRRRLFTMRENTSSPSPIERYNSTGHYTTTDEDSEDY